MLVGPGNFETVDGVDGVEQRRTVDEIDESCDHELDDGAKDDE